MRDDWRYLGGTDGLSVSIDGEVQQGDYILEPFTKEITNRHRWVTQTVNRRRWDYVTQSWESGEENLLVWQLMKEAWFGNWPSNCSLYFIDGDAFNCSIDNIRLLDNRTQKVVLARERENYLYFDRRLQGNVEILELDIVVSGPAEAAKVVKGTKSGVSLVLSQKLKTHKGFHFRWV